MSDWQLLGLIAIIVLWGAIGQITTMLHFRRLRKDLGLKP